MRISIAKAGFCFSGKVSELRELIHPWSQSKATLQEFITLALH